MLTQFNTNVNDDDDDDVFNVRLDRSLPRATNLLPRATGCLFYIEYGTAGVKLFIKAGCFILTY